MGTSTETEGDILYVSPNLSEPILRDGIETFHTRFIGRKAVWIGVFRDQELTLHVGAELKEIEQLGWEIARSLVIVISIVLLLIAADSWRRYQLRNARCSQEASGSRKAVPVRLARRDCFFVSETHSSEFPALSPAHFCICSMICL